MSTPFDLSIEGIGVWSAELPGWQCARAVLAGRAEPTATTTRPAPELLPPTERRRAPEAVLLAVEAAAQACAMARREPRELPHVFASAYGDLAVNDYLCATLARAPREVSPTRFHNSVHNAPAGYWAIATGCRRSSTALSAGDATFGAGLLEAALLATTAPALLVAYDVAAVGPLQDAVACRSAFALALVLAPLSAHGEARMRVRAHAPVAELAPQPSVLQANHRDNPAARGLPLLSALARGEATTLALAAGPGLHLEMEISFG